MPYSLGANDDVWDLFGMTMPLPVWALPYNLSSRFIKWRDHAH